MINPMKAFRAYMAFAQASDTIAKGPKPGLYSTEFWTMAFGVGTILYEGSKGIIPPQYSVYLFLGLSALYISMRFLLKMKHLELPAIPALENPAVEKVLANIVEEAKNAQGVAKTTVTDTKVKVEAEVKAAETQLP